MQVLDLSNSQLILSLGLFSGLDNLKILDLSNNNFTTLDAKIFTGLSNLISLYLDGNYFDHLGEEVFYGIDNLEELYLREIELGEIGTSKLNLSDRVFSNLRNLQILDLSGKNLSYISNTFSYLSNLKKLILYRHYPWWYVPPGIEPLNLDGKIFSNLTNLEFLDLTGNLIDLDDEIFSNLINLKDLNLSNYQLFEDDSSPYCWPGLKYNSSKLFSSLIKLENLGLSCNQIDDSYFIEFLFFLPPQLISLDISGNKLTALPESFSEKLSKLEILFLYGNPINPDDFFGEFINYLPFNITVLGLYFGDQETRITENVFSKLNHLQELYLYVNLVELSNKSFSGLINLKILESFLFCYRNLPPYYLTDEIFSDLINLEELYFTFYGVKLFLSDKVFKNLNKLKHLDLSQNDFIMNLTTETFIGLNHLEFLSLGGAGAESLVKLPSRVFQTLTNLQDLELYYAGLKWIEKEAFLGLNSLKSLNLMGNILNDTAINNLTLSFPPSVSNLDLRWTEISDTGLSIFAQIIPCTNLSNIYLDPLKSKTGVDEKLAENSLRKVCEDEICGKSCNTNPIVIINSTINKHRFHFLASEPVYFNNPFPNTPIDSAHALSKSSSESVTSSINPAIMSAAILGIAGLAMLLYKNSTWIKNIR